MKMGSGVWFKNIINKKKARGGERSNKRHSAPGNLDIHKETSCSENLCPVSAHSASVGNERGISHSSEDAAATQIQTAYRAYLARKNFRRIRGMSRLQNLVQQDSVKKQASTTLSYLHAWDKVQSQIRARRAHMVTEGRLRQKKLENQLKLEAKLHDLEVEWNSGSETFDEALARIHQREEAALKRERAMAYAFSHQWRANSNPRFGSSNDELGKTNWGWSWTDRWISAQPWESRVSVSASPKKTNSQQPKKTGKKSISPTTKAPEKIKSISPNGKVLNGKARKLSYEAAEKKGVRRVSPVAEEKKSKNNEKE